MKFHKRYTIPISRSGQRHRIPSVKGLLAPWDEQLRNCLFALLFLRGQLFDWLCAVYRETGTYNEPVGRTEKLHGKRGGRVGG